MCSSRPDRNQPYRLRVGVVAARRTYVVGNVGDARHVCRAVFGVLGDDVETARIDAYSDFDSQMPADIRKAESWLRSRGLISDRRDPAEGICIHRDDDIGWEIARAYTLWSTHVRLRDAAGALLAALDDGAKAITLHLTAAQAAELTDEVGSAATIRDVTTDDDPENLSA
jgi:hypothetical protein